MKTQKNEGNEGVEGIDLMLSLNGDSMITRLGESLLNGVENGALCPLFLTIRLREMERMLRYVSETIERRAIDEAEKYGRSFNYHSAEISIGNHGSYDYTGCGHPQYSELLMQENILKAKKKETENFLKGIKEPINILDEKTGEVVTIQAPVHMTKEILRIKLNQTKNENK